MIGNLRDSRNIFVRYKIRHLVKRAVMQVVLPVAVILILIVSAIFVYKKYGDIKVMNYLDYVSVENPVVRNDAIVKIGIVKDESKLSNMVVSLFFDESEIESIVVKKIGGLLNSKDVDTRRETAITLGRIGDVSASPLLINMLKRKNLDDDTTMSAIESLGKLKDPAAIPIIVTFLQHNDLKIKLTSIWALGSIGDLSAVSKLTRFLNDSDKYLQHQATMALKRIR